jgi:peptidoglycan/xylan/chitin deacetylase (PgdA/CDA1 family)
VRAILTFHSIDDSGSPISVSRSEFRSHVRFLASGRLRVVPLADVARGGDDEDVVALTFDDGFQSFADEALPLLADHAMPATVFVVSDCVGGTNNWGGVAEPDIPTLPLMRWDDVARAKERGIEVGAHTRRHPDLTTLPDGVLADEVAGSAERITAQIGSRPVSFAYPYGKHDLRAQQAVRGVFERACTTEMRWVGTSDDATQLPRIDMYYFRAPGQLEAWGTPSFNRRLWLRAQGRRVRQLAARIGVNP